MQALAVAVNHSFFLEGRVGFPPDQLDRWFSELNNRMEAIRINMGVRVEAYAILMQATDAGLHSFRANMKQHLRPDCTDGVSIQSCYWVSVCRDVM